ncbi:hypothetical protein [Desulfitibacter alkalitolerans]|uniref:hypothetical protein n=1 Tax=Desulfitibacter alkalitolerans TaxID=264641 RepID=UPI0004898296|nr:hypothetical protein [Desulfitibacter alkalitolerans]
MKDRIAMGFIAGIIAGVFMNLIDYIGVYVVGFDDVLLLEWAAVLMYGRPQENMLEASLAQAGQLVFSGFLGIFFAYIMLKITSGNYLFKGWLYGILTWFFIYALTIVFQVPFLTRHPFEAVVVHIIASSVYGLVLAEALKRLDQGVGLIN